MTTVGLIGLGTDQVAVKTGRHNGLGIQLKQSNKIVIQVHRLAHRINFATSQASRDIDYLEWHQGHISSIYKLYSIARMRYVKLKEIQQLIPWVEGVQGVQP